MTRSRIQKIGFLLVENFSMIAFASAIEPLRTANRIANQTLFNWQIISQEGNPVKCSNGLEIKVDASLNEKLELDILFICGGAFVGLDKIIERRVGKKMLGFGAEIRKEGEKSLGETLAQVQQRAQHRRKAWSGPTSFSV